MDINLSQYMGMYIDGSRENLDLMDKHLLTLEQDPGNLESVGEIFRAAHTLKGMSATMGFEKVAHLTHEMENILDQLRNHTLSVTPPIIDVLFETFDALRILVNDTIESTDSNLDLNLIIQKLKDAPGQASSGNTETVSQPKAAAHSAEDLLAGISVNEYEQQLLIEAQNQGTHIFMVMVTLVNDCLLKAPRAFMVNRALEELNCEIIKSVPDIKDLEDEKFDLSFKKLVFSQAEEAAVREAVESISEVDSVSIVRLTPDDFRTTQQDQAPQPVAEQPPPAKRRAPVAVPQQPIHADEKHADAATAKAPPTAERHSTQTVRVDMRRLDELMNLVGELVINRTRLADIGTAHKLKDLNEALTRVSHISSSLQNVVMQVRMVPIEQVFDRFPRMVRDLSKKLNKKINLVLEGKDTEMDRTVIDEIGDPMVHLIRNAIDHGIESPEERLAKGKSEVGTITLVARHEGNNVLIEVRDDGKGVDPTIIGRLAVERGIYTPEQMAKMPPEEIIRTIFLPGFSTAKEVSDLSGRGVGMDAVKGKLEDLNGVLELESKVGEGSRVIIKLPLTLAILPALMVRVGAEMFAIPLGSLLETMDINKSDINIVQHQEVTLLRGDVLPIIRLRNVLNVPTSEEEQKYIAAKEDEISIVVCSAGEKRAGFMVDELLGQQEIVIKSLGNLLGGLPGIMGATMRGDGSIALILDIPSFFQKGQTIQS